MSITLNRRMGSIASSEQALAPHRRLAAAMTVVAVMSFGCAVGGMIVDRNSDLIATYFLAVQDAPVLLLFGLFLVALRAILPGSKSTTSPLDMPKPQHGFRVLCPALVLGCGIIWAGSGFVYLHFGLSLDEFFAEFDAKIIAAGRLVASVAPDWRAFVPALQPIFRLELPDNAYWVSSYLPMNAAIRAVFVLLGAPAWEGVVLAGVAIAALFGTARRLWPDRPDAALVSIILLVCSTQFLITAMTPYAMTAHLAFNMMWLYLFLRDTRAAHLGNAGIAFVACGLHQVVFHPLFVAPFVVSLIMVRRWKLATYYIAVYGVIGIFWVLYWSLVLREANASMAQSADVGALNFIQRIVAMTDFSPAGLSLMGVNVIRFLAWQSPLVIPLAAVGLFAGRERNMTLVNLAAGVALTLILMLILMPFQGHGWGYRYLHGFLGAFSLMAAQGWISVTECNANRSRIPMLALSSSVLLSLLVLLPWRAYQVRAFVEPYASAVKAIERSDADVVIVDPTDIWYGEDLVRNDPFLRAPPKVLSLPRLSEARLGELCRRFNPAIFDRVQAQQLGLRIVPSPPAMVDRDSKLRKLARSWGCGHPVNGSRS